ncbi:MAG: LCCL domain-containing protein [Polyangiales bacterium]
MHTWEPRRPIALALFALSLATTAAGCGRSAAVQTTSSLALRRVVIYRNGVGYFERQGHVTEDEVRFRVTQREVGDFLATLAVMEQGGSSVRSASFPMPEATRDEASADARRTVRLSLDGRDHDLLVGYTVETPIWRPSYRLVFTGDRAQVQAWGIVQNLSGEDWSGVRLSLVAGAPVSFRSELAQAVIPTRPVVTDEGAVIDAVPMGDTTLAQTSDAPTPEPAPAPTPTTSQTILAMEGDDTAGALDQAEQRGLLDARGRREAEHAAAAATGAEVAQRMNRQRTIVRGPAPTPRSATPRNVASLAALAAQGGTTRYDLPNPVTVPDRSATMVMLVARDIPGERMYLFAPDPGVADSSSHPFHVARFENRTGALLERGPIAIFEENNYLGEALLDPLPDAATTTLPFALERALAVERTPTAAIEGARLVRMQRESLTIERYNVTRTTYAVRNGMDRPVRVMVRHALDGAQLHEPPTGAEVSGANALVPVSVPARSHADVIVTTRSPFAMQLDLSDEQAALAIEAFLRDAHPADEVATALRTTLDLRHQIDERTREHADLEQRREDLQQNAEETRQNLRAIQRNPQAADLRASLTARLGRVAAELDQLTRRIVELDTQIGERRVRLAETTRGIDIDTSRAPDATPAATAPTATRTPERTAPTANDGSWAVNALSHRGHNGQTFTYRCSAGAAPRNVWGTGIYSDDSSVCTAAVHAGRINPAAGGVVTIEIRPGRARYAGSARNGVTSMTFAAWPGSFVVR